jgi:tetratricopeptide (TPR) repeat protein
VEGRSRAQWSTMDAARGRIDEAIARAQKEHEASNYRGAIELLLLLQTQEKLSPQQEYRVVSRLSDGYRNLLDFGSALPHLLRALELVPGLHGRRSLEHATVLKALALAYVGTKQLGEAGTTILEALSIMEELGLTRDKEYGHLPQGQGCVSTI